LEGNYVENWNRPLAIANEQRSTGLFVGTFIPSVDDQSGSTEVKEKKFQHL